MMGTAGPGNMYSDLAIKQDVNVASCWIFIYMFITI
jgi:hypothetical protein